MKKMNLKSILAPLLVMAFIIGGVSIVKAAESEWKLVIRVAGVVENKYAGSNVWNLIWQSRKLKDGDMARTGEKSRAKIRLADQSVITLGEKTEVEMSEFKLNNRTRASKIKLFFGKVRANVGRFAGKENRFEVETPNAVLAARGTDFLTEYGEIDNRKETTRVTVFEDSVDVTVDNKTVRIYEGQSATIGDDFFQINPASFGALLTMPDGAPQSDADLFMSDYGGAATTDFASVVPGDPTTTTLTSVPGIESTTVTGVPQPAIIQPPPGNSGTVNVNIIPGTR